MLYNNSEETTSLNFKNLGGNNMNRREATWARTGVNITSANNIEEALKISGLDYAVEKQPIFLGAGNAIPDKFATVKAGTDEVFGIVGNNYTICQNYDAFDFVNYIEEDLQFVKAGETRTGLIYVIARLPEQYVLGDKMAPYVIFQNGHNGNIPVRAAIAPLRIVCQNQFNIAFKNSDNTVRIRHASTLDTRLANAREVLKTTASYMDTFRKVADELATTSIKGLEFKIVDTFFELPETSNIAAIERVERKRHALLRAYSEDDNANFRGTAWGMVNAYTDFVTHQEPGRYTDNWEESRFMNVTFDPKQVQSFLKHLKQFA
jgi:phage/plasmid-like protein (TIGR03299 family)